MSSSSSSSSSLSLSVVGAETLFVLEVFGAETALDVVGADTDSFVDCFEVRDVFNDPFISLETCSSSFDFFDTGNSTGSTTRLLRLELPFNFSPCSLRISFLSALSLISGADKLFADVVIVYFVMHIKNLIRIFNAISGKYFV